MKRETVITAFLSGALALLIGLGAVGCVISAFDLTIQNLSGIALACVAAAVFCAAMFSLKWGGLGVLAALTLFFLFLWRKTDGLEQLFCLLQRVTHLYNNAYGWSVLRLTDAPWDAGVGDIPMAALGVSLCAVVTRAVCRGKSSALPVTAALLPLGACLVVTDTVPEESCLFALILGLILLILTGRVRANDPVQGNRLTLMAAVPTALALLALFLALPREGYVNQAAATREKLLSRVQFSLSRTEESSRNAVENWLQNTLETQFSQNSPISPSSGETETVNLVGLGRRIESTAVVMEVTPLSGGALYLRGQDYDRYDGTGWSVSPGRTEVFSGSGEDLGEVFIRTTAEEPVLYLPYYPTGGVSLSGGRLENRQNSTEYTVPRTGLPESWQSGTETSSYYDPVYLTLPDTIREGAEDLLSEILPEGGTAAQKADRIAEYVRSCARYDLNPSRMDAGEPDFALWFLEDAEAGYCVHFATAAVVLLRAAGMEARYVSGYMVRTRAGETAAVTGKNAHAWAEYYEPSLGTWVVLEATPADAGGQPAVSETNPQPATEADVIQPTRAPAVPSVPENGNATIAPETPDSPPARIPVGFFTALLALVLIAAVIPGQRALRIRLRRAKQQKAPPNARALALWQEAALASRLLRKPAPKTLESLAQKAKFSQHTLTEEELIRFHAYLRGAKKQLAGRPWYQRLVYKYIYAVL